MEDVHTLIEEFLEDAGWVYDFHEAGEIAEDTYVGAFEFDERCAFERVKYYLSVSKNGLILNFHIPIDIPPHRLCDLTESIARINFGENFASFVIAVDEKAMFCRIPIIYSSLTENPNHILRWSFNLGLATIVEFGYALVDVLKNVKTPKQAIDDARAEQHYYY